MTTAARLFFFVCVLNREKTATGTDINKAELRQVSASVFSEGNASSHRRKAEEVAESHPPLNTCFSNSLCFAALLGLKPTDLKGVDTSLGRRMCYTCRCLDVLSLSSPRIVE